MAPEHFFAKAWSLSFERFSQEIRDFLKNLLLKCLHIHASCTVSIGKKPVIDIWHSVVVQPAKPKHCSFTVKWFSGTLKFLVVIFQRRQLVFSKGK